jgi:enamine deaminase RidA (YjgF/YER057c/UK114 family)
MDMRPRRDFVNSMMMAAAASPMLLAQQGAAPDGAAPGGQQGGGRRGGGRGVGAARPPRPRPAGIVWVSGQGSNDGVPNADHPARLKVTDPYEDHCRYTMEALKRSIERLGGTMDDFLYMQVFFCLPLDDSTPTPTGSAAAAAYLKCYNALSPIYNSFWTGPHGAPPRSCFALQWIPGSSLLEMVGAAYIDPNATPAAPGPPAARP